MKHKAFYFTSDGIDVILTVVIHHDASLRAPLWCDVLEVMLQDEGGRCQTAASSLWQECKHQHSPKEWDYDFCNPEQNGFNPRKVSHIPERLVYLLTSRLISRFVCQIFITKLWMYYFNKPRWNRFFLHFPGSSKMKFSDWACIQR